MNQQLIFNDDAHWNATLGCIECSVIHGGMKVPCTISADYLAPISSPQTAAEWLTVYEAQRFDIEEALQQLVEQELFTAAGQLAL